MALNSRQSKLTEKDEDYIFTWKLFTSWDFMIGNPETAHNRVASIILGFKEALLEEAEKTREEKRKLVFFTCINIMPGNYCSLNEEKTTYVLLSKF